MTSRNATKCFGALMLLAVTATGAAAHGKHKEHGAHQHGHGRFNMAIEKQSVSIELDIPASDIVGFEYEPKTDKDKAAVEAAKKKLADPLRLFGVPKGAQCTVANAKVELETDAKDAADKAQKGHADFHAQYALTCAKPADIVALDFAFFADFPNAQELEVVVISEKGQMKTQAKRKARKVAITLR